MKKKVLLSFTVLFNLHNLFAQKISTSRIIGEQEIIQLKRNLSKITGTSKPRNYRNVSVLNDVANYIKAELKKICDSVTFQEFDVNKKIYKNIIGLIGVNHK